MDKQVRVLVTGEKHRAEAIARDIYHSTHAKAFPTITYVPRALSPREIQALTHLSSYHYILFSSPRAVAFFIDILRKKHIELPIPLPTIAAVGPATARACQDAGLPVTFIPETFGSTKLSQTLPRLSKKKILFPRSTLAAPQALTLLRRRGASVTELRLYRTVPINTEAKKTPFSKNTATIVFFMSPSSVTGFSNQIGKRKLRTLAPRLYSVCLGQSTVDAATAAGFTRIKILRPS